MSWRIIDLDIDEALSADTLVSAVALVEFPAIETEFMYFSAENFEETFVVTDEISNIACRARKWKEENGSSCGTNIGWTRSAQLCNKENISLDTVKRMYSYLSRHKVDLESSKDYETGCGKLMYDAWGGEPALGWSERIINRYEEMDIDVSNLPEYVQYPTGETKNDMLIKPVAFIEKIPYERKEDYIGRCIAYHIKEKGMDTDQAAAVCYQQAEDEFAEDMGNPCWEGYEPLGTKIKDGKEVPNCIPVKQGAHFGIMGYIGDLPIFSTKEDAIEYGETYYDCDGYHEYQTEEGEIVYMPCGSHDDLIKFEYSQDDLELLEALSALTEYTTEFEAIYNELIIGYDKM